MADYFPAELVIVPDFAYYQSIDGQLSAASFAEILPAAIAEVDAEIGGNDVTEETVTKYKDCVCAIADALFDPALSSEGAGRTTATYLDPRSRRHIITSHLTGTGLLYRGI